MLEVKSEVWGHTRWPWWRRRWRHDTWFIGADWKPRSRYGRAWTRRGAERARLRNLAVLTREAIHHANQVKEGQSWSSR